MLVMGLPYKTTIMVRYIPSIPSFFLIRNWCWLNFWHLLILSCDTYINNYTYSNWFVLVEPSRGDPTYHDQWISWWIVRLKWPKFWLINLHLLGWLLFCSFWAFTFTIFLVYEAHTPHTYSADSIILKNVYLIFYTPGRLF